MTLPNLLTLARLLATPLIALLAAAGGPDGGLYAAALFAAAAVTDWLDGYLARKLNQTSAFGAMFDPIADKVQVGVVLGVLLWLGALGGWHLVPALAILAREVFVSGLREAMAATNAPRIPSSFAAKAKTTFQMAALALLLLAWWLPAFAQGTTPLDSWIRGLTDVAGTLRSPAEGWSLPALTTTIGPMISVWLTAWVLAARHGPASARPT